MKKIRLSLALFLCAATFLSGCSMLTARGRQEAAYERYVRKSSLGRVKQQKRLSYKKTKIPTMQPSEPSETTAVSGPEALSSGSSSEGGGGQ
jgi:hypothetical protein